jgi:pyruvate dehydrogenase E2 component (dihydrolipoamide acetyltransferase)
MSVKITLEFKSVDEAIVALGKLTPEAHAKALAAATQVPAAAAAPATEAPAKTRKPRADAGQPRGPYKTTEQNAVAAGGAPTGTQPTEAPAQSTPAQAPVAPAAAAVPATAAQPQASTPAPESAPAAAVVVPTPEQVQAAVEGLYNAKGFDICSEVLGRYGVKRGKDLLPEQRADFIAEAKARATAQPATQQAPI